MVCSVFPSPISSEGSKSRWERFGGLTRRATEKRWGARHHPCAPKRPHLSHPALPAHAQVSPTVHSSFRSCDRMQSQTALRSVPRLPPATSTPTSHVPNPTPHLPGCS